MKTFISTLAEHEVKNFFKYSFHWQKAKQYYPIYNPHLMLFTYIATENICV